MCAGGFRGWGWLGGSPTHVHMHMHTRMGGKHDNFMQMAAPIGFGEIPMMSYAHACACMHMHVHMYRGHPLTTPHLHPPTPYPPEGATSGISQNSIALEVIKIFQFCLKIYDL